MNTVGKIDNSFTIPNIPIKKWCMLTITLQGHILDVFLNGYLKKSHDFKKEIPKLNDESIYFTHWDGFKGYIVLTTERWKYPIRIHSVHLQNSRTLKNLKVKFEKL